MKVGNLEIVPLLDGGARLSAQRYLRYTGAGDDPWGRHEGLVDADGNLLFAMGGFLVRTGDRVVVIDTGVGRIDNGTYWGGGFLDSLAGAGVSPAEVTDVVLTHLHFDHVGWATQKGAIVFDHATYRCHAADWDHFVAGPAPEEGAVRKLSPLEGRLELFDADTELAPGVSVRHAPGHTPGSAVVVISDRAERALLLGDAVHCPVELEEDAWEFVYDVDPALAIRTREALAREIEGTDVPVAAAHFPGLRFGRLLPGTGRRQWVFS